MTSNLVVTNYHVIEECKRLKVRRDTVVHEAGVRATSEISDLALLEIAGNVQRLPVVRQSAALGEEIMIAGHPLAGLLGNDLIVTGGQVSSLAGLRNDPAMLQISAPAQPGNSGGPVLDRTGSIVGVVVAKLNVLKVAALTGDLSQNVNFAIKPEVLRLFLDTNRVPYRTSGESKRLDGAELADHARGFTVQVVCVD